MDLGSITDGDDRKWSGDRSVLEGGGGWHDLKAEFQKKKVRTRVATDRFAATILGKPPASTLHENGNETD